MTPRIGIIGLSGQSLLMRTDHFHNPGETITADSLFTEPGGKGYNQAVAAKRLGAEVRYLSCIGRDGDGESCVRRMREEGVDAQWVYAGCPTACAHVLTDREGENRVTVFRGAADRLTAEDVTARADWLFNCDALLLQLECPQETVRAALDVARALRVPVFLNPAPACALPADWLSRFALLLPNRREASQLFSVEDGGDAPLLHRAMRRLGVEKLLVTLGAEGSLYIDRDETLRFPATRVGNVVDTTGAGDTFCAAFVLRWLETKSIREAVRFATDASALSISHAHVLDGLPRRTELIPRPDSEM